MRKLLILLAVVFTSCATQNHASVKCIGSDCPLKQEREEPELSDKQIKKLIEKRAEELAREKLKQEKASYEMQKISKELSILKASPTPVKAPDTVIRVLILPYVDSNGVLNTAKYTFLTVETGRWILGDYLLSPNRQERIKRPLAEDSLIDRKIKEYLNEKKSAGK